MKKKFLAILLGAIMSVTCALAFAACSGGSENPTPGGSGKTTVDSFDEWYQAYMDTINSDNYTYSGRLVDGVFFDGNYSVSRQGDKLSSTATSDGTEEISYGQIFEDKIIEYKVGQNGEWNSIEHNAILGGVGDNTDFFIDFRFKLMCFSFVNEIMVIGGLTAMIGQTFTDEQTLKANMEEAYEHVTYDEENNCYYLGNYVGSESDNYVKLKFLNGKISYLAVKESDPQNNRNIYATYDFTYGGASVTIPDEVFASNPEQ